MFHTPNLNMWQPHLMSRLYFQVFLNLYHKGQHHHNFDNYYVWYYVRENDNAT